MCYSVNDGIDLPNRLLGHNKLSIYVSLSLCVYLFIVFFFGGEGKSIIRQAAGTRSVEFLPTKTPPPSPHTTLAPLSHYFGVACFGPISNSIHEASYLLLFDLHSRCCFPVPLILVLVSPVSLHLSFLLHSKKKKKKWHCCPLFFSALSIYLFIYLSFYLSIYPSIYVSIYLYILLCIYSCTYLSIYLSYVRVACWILQPPFSQPHQWETDADSSTGNGVDTFLPSIWYVLYTYTCRHS